MVAVLAMFYLSSVWHLYALSNIENSVKYIFKKLIVKVALKTFLNSVTFVIIPKEWFLLETFFMWGWNTKGMECICPVSKALPV